MKKITRFFVKVKPFLVLPFLLVNLSNFYGQGLSADNKIGQKWTNVPFDYKVFIENKGQFDGKSGLSGSPVLYGVDNTNSQGYQAYFSAKGVSYRLDEWGISDKKQKKLDKLAQEENGDKVEFEINEANKEDQLKKLDLLRTAMVNVEWVDANPNVQVVSENMDTEYFNYPNANDLSKSINFVKSYKNIIYKDLYPNIDVIYSFPEGKRGIKYALILHPGADVTKIKMKYSGADNLSLDANGNIHAKTVFGDIIDHAPFTFYDENKNVIASSFELYNNTVSFKFTQSFNNSKTIVIDPWTATPAFTSTNKALEIDCDAAGSVYVYGGLSPNAIRKYSSAGIVQWTTQAIAPYATNWVGDFAVDFAGNSYVGNGFANGMLGKYTTAGVMAVVHSSVSAATGTTWEFFNLCFNKPRTNLIGGGNAGGKTVGNINLTTLVPSGINTLPSFAASELRGTCSSVNGNYFGITISNGTPGKVFAITPGFGVVWNVNSQYAQVNHGYTTPNYAFGAPGSQNAIAASGCYVYTYNGDTIRKRNINTGALVAVQKVAGAGAGLCSGIIVDSCENVYVGTQTGISKYDSNLSFVTSGNTPGAVYDIAFSTISNEIVACGNAMVASVAGLVLPCPQAVLSLTVTSTPATCGQNNGSATVTVSGGLPAYTYTWTPSAQNGSVATGLGAGIYTVTVKDNSCIPLIKTATVQILSVVSGTLGIASQTNVACFGGNTGAATASMTGGSGTYNYTWTPTAQTGTLASNLSAGVYTVNVLSSSGCTAVTTVTITQPPAITATITSANVLCNAATTGSAYVNANGGTGAYTYSWSTTATTQSVTNLGSGIYSVTVKDANGCTLTKTVNITQPTALTITPNSSAPTACTGNSITLSAIVSGGTSAYTYTWTAGPSNTNYTVTSSTGGIFVYTVTGTDANSCTVSKTISVTFVANPTVTASSATVCFGQVATLNANGAATYTWTGGSTGTTFTASPAVGVTNYTVIGSSGTCTGSATASITVNALPTPTASNNSPVCEGTPINLTGLGGTTYTWTGPSAFTSTQQNPSIATASLSNSGTYSLIVSSAAGCTNIATTNVTVNAVPVVVVTHPTVCLNQNINLSANGGTAYTWSGPLSYTSAIQNPVINNATLPMSGQYTVVVTGTSGCTNTAISNVTVYPLPNPGIISNSPVCAGNILTLNGSGGATFSWLGPNGFNSNLQNPTITNVTMLANGVYTLLVASGSCSAQTTATVVISPLPVISFSNTAVLCSGGNTGTSTSSVTSGTGPYNYSWSNGSTTGTTGNLPAGTYTLVVTDANGCVSTAVTTITQPNPMNLNINSSAPSACANTPINLTGVAGGGTGPLYTYTWMPGPVGSGYNVTEINAGTYTYSLVSTDQNGCVISKTINLTFFPQPTVTASSATLCAGGKVTLSANGASTYTWTPGNVVGNVYTITTNNTMNLTVVGSANGCVGQATAAIIVNPLPSTVLKADNNKGCVPVCLSFTSSASGSVATTAWDFGDGFSYVSNSNTTTRCFEIAGDYTVSAVITDVNGCTATAIYTVQTFPKPIADFNYAPYKPIVNNSEVTFTDASYGAVIAKWDWYFKDLAKPHSSEQNPIYIYDEAGTYAAALVVTSDHGCMDTIVQSIVVGEDYGIYVPNVFSPNGDGLNDVFQPKGFGIKWYELRIFNRWGEELMFTNDFGHGWDGIYKGVLSKEDTYTWHIRLMNVFGKSHELTGNVTLIK